MSYDWEYIAKRARALGYDKPRVGDISRIASVLTQLDPIPFPDDALAQVRDFLIDSLRNVKLGDDRPGGVYLTFYGAESGSEFMKVGISSNFHSRLKAIRTSNPMEELWTWVAEVPNRREAREIERAILSHLSDSAAYGEWVHAKCANYETAQAMVESISDFINASPCGPVMFERLEADK